MIVLVVGEAQAMSGRRWTPAEAERRARTGAFDRADKDQLLADLPEEWKKEHKRIVRQIESGERGRNGKKEGMRESVIEKEISPITREIFESDDKMATEGINVYFKKAIDSIYDKIQTKKKGLVLKPKSDIELTIAKPSNFGEKSQGLILLINPFLKNIVKLENNGTDSESSLNKIGIDLLNYLIKLREESTDNSIIDALKWTVEILDWWVSSRLDNYIAENKTKEFEGLKKALNSAKEKFEI